MFVEVYSEEFLIGTARLTDLDPPMGVASGVFVACEAYDMRMHANLVEGQFWEARGASLIVRLLNHELIECEGISIHDMASSAGERQLTLLGISSPQYATLFAEFEQYKAYWSS
jgi:hypothetical protein